MHIIPTLDTIHFNTTHDPTNLSSEVIGQFAKDARALGCRRVIVSGVEPRLEGMIGTDWREVARIFDAEGMEVAIATAGTRVDDELAAFLATLGKVTVSVSIEGDEAHLTRPGGRTGAHRQTLAGLRALLAAGLDVDVDATLFSGNLDDLPFLTRIARDLGCNVRLSLLDPGGRGALDLEGILRLREYCHSLREMGVPIFVDLPPLLQYLDEVIPGRGATSCGIDNFCSVLANGDVTIAGVVAGNLATRRFSNIWSRSGFPDGAGVLDLRGVCGRCAFREFCGGAGRPWAFRTDGDFVAPYELCQRFYDAGYIPEDILDEAEPTAAIGESRSFTRLPILQ